MGDLSSLIGFFLCANVTVIIPSINGILIPLSLVMLD